MTNIPRTFENMAQRAIYYFVVTTPSFNPTSSKSVSEKQQESAYRFIKGIYDKLFDNPELLGMKLRPDDYIVEHHLPKKDHPGLFEGIRGYIKNINIFVETLFNIVNLGKSEEDTITIAKDACEIKSNIPKKLANFGVTTAKDDKNYHFTFPADTVKGMQLLATISYDYSHHTSATTIHKKSVSPFLLFSRGVFNPQAPYTVEIFHNIYENKEAFDKMNDYFVKNGFSRVDNKEYIGGLHGDLISLDYVKFYGKPEGKIEGSWKVRNFSGVSFRYNEFLQSFATISIHLPYYRELLESVEKMKDNVSPTVISFLSRHNNCGGCGYCVQMDKTKTKPLRFVTIDSKKVCPLYNFNMWNDFATGTWLPDEVGEVMDFIDELFADRRVDV